jgi:hypothetical protein
MEYWSDGVEGIKKLRLYYPILQHSIIPCGWHRYIAIKWPMMSKGYKIFET